MEEIKVYEETFRQITSGKVSTVLLDNDNNIEPTLDIEINVEYPISTDTLLCNCCNITFHSVPHQREHYKLDWHRYNLKHNNAGKDILTQEQFDMRNGDVSSISGSDSEEEEDNLESLATAQGKLLLKTESSRVLSLYRCLLVDKKTEIDDNILPQKLNPLRCNNRWTVLMLGGGHFAGAVFENGEAVLHKTFHCYTVRAGQGGSQSSKDNKSAGSGPKSAGASLRRYNETALVQHVTGILETWKEQIAKSAVIFIRAAGPYNKNVLFGGKTPLLNRADERIRTVPFSTRRATFSEVTRVYGILTTIAVYESVEKATAQFVKTKLPETEAKRSKTRLKPVTNRAKSRESIQRPSPVSPQISDDESDTEPQFENSTLEISFRDTLVEFEDSLSFEDKLKSPVIRKQKKSKTQKEAERVHEMREAVKVGNLEKLEGIFKVYDSIASTEKVVEKVVDAAGNTLLHVACIHEQIGIIKYLIENEADICIKNKAQQTPYVSTQSKLVREFFKEYAVENPDKHNYNKAQIPVRTVEVNNEEIAERKRLQRKAKREKEKEKKRDKEKEQKEKQEQERFSSLSDREKRALAAERRIMSQSGAVTSRCFLCGSDMAGKVPFEYSGSRFCTIECLKAHRMRNPIVLS